MLTNHELDRIRRQASRRRRVVLAQRRLTAALHRDPPTAESGTGPDGSSTEPTVEH